MLVTKDQAVKLKGWGFIDFTWDSYFIMGRGDIVDVTNNEWCNHNELKNYVSAPTISQALDFMREEKGIVCSVDFDYNGQSKIAHWYYGTYLFGEEVLRTVDFETHPIAELALLEEIIKYIEENE